MTITVTVEKALITSAAGYRAELIVSVDGLELDTAAADFDSEAAAQAYLDATADELAEAAYLAAR